MKTLRFLGVCLLASLLCVNFSACGGEDTPEPENPATNPSNPTPGNGSGTSSNEKRLVKAEFIDSGESTKLLSFEYDEQGRVVKIIEENSYSDYITNHIYSWKENRIIYHEEGDSEDEKIYYTIDNKLVTSRYRSGDYSSEYSFYYDKNGNISGMSVNGGSLTHLFWNNNRFSGHNDWSSSSDYTYGNLTCEGFFPYLGTIVDDWGQYISWAQPSLFGLESKYLPIKIVETNKDNGARKESSFSYTFDDDGYIKSCSISISSTYDGEIWSRTSSKYYFTWE